MSRRNTTVKTREEVEDEFKNLVYTSYWKYLPQTMQDKILAFVSTKSERVDKEKLKTA